MVFAPPLCFQRGFPLLRSASTQEPCTAAADPLARSSGVTAASPGSHQTCPSARHFHTKPPLVGKGDTTPPASAEPTPYRDPLSHVELSQALLPGGNCWAPRMFSCFPGWERAKGWRSALSRPPLGTEHAGLCSPASSGRAAPSPGDMARPHSSSSHWRMRNHEHKWAEPISASFLSASCRYQTRSFPAWLLHSAALLYWWGFSSSHVAGRGKIFSWCPGAQTLNEKL